MTNQTTTTAADLTTRALLVKLSITQWSARRQDKRAAQEIATAHNAAADRLSVHKALVSKAALEAISSAANAARAAHYELTLPWLDNGTRILPARAFERYKKTIAPLREEFMRQVKDFCAAYPALREQARLALNGLFNPADYPTPDRIPAAFTFDFAFSNLPAADDFRVALSYDDVEQIKQEIQARTAAAQAEATADIYRRIQEVLTAAVDRLGTPRAIFRDSLIENIARLAEILPELNITNDPALEELRADLAARLAPLAPQRLRDNPMARREAAASAHSILAKLTAYTGQQTPPAPPTEPAAAVIPTGDIQLELCEATA